MKIVLAAEESAGTQVLKRLLVADHDIVAVLTSEGERGAVARGANAARLEVMPARLVRDDAFAEWMRERDADLLLNVHSLHIAASSVVAAPRIGSFNLHPGPLPAYAGLNAPSWAIYHGEEMHGVTLHWMDPGIDTGPVAFSERLRIAPDDTGLSLSVRCIKAGVPLVERLLNVASADPGAIPREPQTGPRRYYGPDPPDQGRLSWNRTASAIVNHVRAADYSPFASPWGNPWTSLSGQEIAVVKGVRTGEPASAPHGTIGEPTDDGVPVACADEWVLVQLVRIDDGVARARDVLTPGARFT